jgi:hypothetical protein
MGEKRIMGRGLSAQEKEAIFSLMEKVLWQQMHLTADAIMMHQQSDHDNDNDNNTKTISHDKLTEMPRSNTTAAQKNRNKKRSSKPRPPSFSLTGSAEQYNSYMDHWNIELADAAFTHLGHDIIKTADSRSIHAQFRKVERGSGKKAKQRQPSRAMPQASSS